MKDVAQLQKILELVLWSGRVKGERPLSLLLIAGVECGKTEMLNKFSLNKTVWYGQDATAYGIQRDVLPSIESGQVTHIIIPDLITPLSRRYSTVKTFVSFMNGLIEEGMANISTYVAKLTTENRKPVNCGLITSITPALLEDKRRHWNKMGFLSRLIPFSYSYSEKSERKIRESIFNCLRIE